MCFLLRDHVELRAVHMAVDEARQDQAAAVVDARPACAGIISLDPGDAAVGADQQPMVGAKSHGRAGDIGQGGLRDEIEQVAAQRQAEAG